LTVIETLARRNLVEVSGTPSLRRLLWVENSFFFSLDTSPTISQQPPDTMMNSDDRLVGLPLPTQTKNAAEVTGAGHVAQETLDEENSDFEQPSEGDSDDTRGRAPASSGYEVVAPVSLSDEDMSEGEEDNNSAFALTSPPRMFLSSSCGQRVVHHAEASLAHYAGGHPLANILPSPSTRLLVFHILRSIVFSAPSCPRAISSQAVALCQDSDPAR
jgi:hypothetical protein